jgi:hypothetical protein
MFIQKVSAGLNYSDLMRRAQQKTFQVDDLDGFFLVAGIDLNL